MITRQELEQRLHNRERKVKFEALAKELSDQHFPLTELIDLTFHSDREIAFRAAWLLEMTFILSPPDYIEDIAYLLRRFPEVKNDSCRRHYAKILLNITGKKTTPAISEKLRHTDLEPIVETLFEWLIDPQIKIAVKVFSADALLQLSCRYPWIKDELHEQIKFLMRDGTAAIQSRGKKILKALEKEKHLQND